MYSRDIEGLYVLLAETRCTFVGTSIGLRSRGLTPLRAALLRTLKEPKPTRRTSLPSLRDWRIVTSVASNTSADFFWVNPVCVAMLLVSSCRPTMVDSAFVADFFVVAMGSKSSLQQSAHVASHPIFLIAGPVERLDNSLPLRSIARDFAECKRLRVLES